MAVSGAVVQGLMGQIDRLLELLNTTYRHVKEEWKLLTLFIGANNLCSCHSENSRVAVYERYLREAVLRLRAEVPYTFVNIHTIFNSACGGTRARGGRAFRHALHARSVSNVWDDAQGKLYCKKAVPLFHECGCLNANATDRTVMDELGLAYNVATTRVAAEIQALHDPRFTVVVQPGVDSVPFGKYGEDFLSDLDCFRALRYLLPIVLFDAARNRLVPPSSPPSPPDPSLCGDELFALAIVRPLCRAARHTASHAVLRVDK